MYTGARDVSPKKGREGGERRETWNLVSGTTAAFERGLDLTLINCFTGGPDSRDRAFLSPLSRETNLHIKES